MMNSPRAGCDQQVLYMDIREVWLTDGRYGIWYAIKAHLTVCNPHFVRPRALGGGGSRRVRFGNGGRRRFQINGRLQDSD